MPGIARLDLLLATGLAVAGALEVLLGAGDGRLAGALAVPLATLPLAWRRSAPLVPLAALAVVLPVQAQLGGSLVESVTGHAAVVIALYSGGRHLAGAAGLAGAAVSVAALWATWIAFDPSIRDAADALLMLVYLPLPLLAGRWMRGQALLRRELVEKGRELERERGRNARQAAEDERMRIAGDLQAAVTGGLAAIVADARRAAGDPAESRALLAAIAARAREALADVRRILGILRHEEPPAPLAPSAGADGAARSPAADAALVTREPSVAGPHDDAPVTGQDDGASGARRHDALVTRLDRALVALLLIGAWVELAVAAPAGDLPLAALIAAAIVVPLLWRRRRPVVVAAAVLGAIAVQSAVVGLDRFPVADGIAMVCATYAVGAHAGRRTALAGLALLVAGAALHAAVFHPDAVVPAVLGAVVVPWIAGRTIRGRRRLTGELRERAARIRHAREQDARIAMSVERARVARELHDAVAHNLSVIAIQAAGADGVVDRDPARAAQCAELIEAVGREALAELGRLVGPPGEDAQQPSLSAVDALTQRARDEGLDVDLRIEGEPTALPAGVDLAAYRIVQEALANTAKHSGAEHAWVVVRYDPRAVEIEVADDGRGPNGAPAPRNGGGHGLVGIRERVALYRGTVRIDRRHGGGFLVNARLPIA